MLKIGMSYQRMSDNQNARFYLEQVVSQHPGTRAANLARQQLSKLP